MQNHMKYHPLMKIVNSALVDMPAPSTISFWWSMGSLAGLTLMIQLITGVFLAMHYVSDIELAFDSVNHITRNVTGGWLIRTIHANGASFFFAFLYMHTGRALYYGSYYHTTTWMVGVTILLASMATAFLGYVLPWGQMSFWGATVITNLFSAIPYLGKFIVSWLWGGFAIEKATLTRFFAFHFMLPFIIMALVMIHLLFLHTHGSSNPLGLKSTHEKIPLGTYFGTKDMLGFILFLTALLLLAYTLPWMLGDPENFIPANPLVTPIHIQPEWYFLFAYAILRSIPNKLGGVIALALSIMILYFLPFFPKPKYKGLTFYPFNQAYFFFFILIFFCLTWIGARPVEQPYMATGQICTFLYFFYFFSFPYLQKLSDM